MKQQIILDEEDVIDILKKHLETKVNATVKSVAIDIGQTYDRMERPIGYKLNKIVLEIE